MSSECECVISGDKFYICPIHRKEYIENSSIRVSFDVKEVVKKIENDIIKIGKDLEDAGL